MFDVTFNFLKEVKNLHPVLEVSMELLMDSKKKFDVLSKNSRTFENFLILDVACGRKAFRKMEIIHFCFIRSNDSHADVCTKSMRKSRVLSVTATSELSYIVEL